VAVAVIPLEPVELAVVVQVRQVLTRPHRGQRTLAAAVAALEVAAVGLPATAAAAWSSFELGQTNDDL
jgi:hypothetical protein